ncbi:MAG: Flp family type IVb pilin [Kiloniellales bacterium]
MVLQLNLWLRDRRGATMVEYGLIIALVAFAIVIGATALGFGLRDMYGVIVDRAVPAITGEP